MVFVTLSLFDNGPAFPAIVMDPPWAERGGGKIKRGADRHYQLADQDEIIRAVTKSPLFRPAANAHAWVWVTDNFLEDGLGLVEAMGFRYVRTFVWVKAAEENPEETLRFGIGQYGRGAHETLLFAVRGSGQDPSVWKGDRGVPSVFFAPVPRDPETGKRIHSRKPDASYRLIERVSRGPYAELFARRRWGPDWHVWGNEAPTGGQ